MHLLHNYIAHNLADHLRKARVVVWYDPPGDYLLFIASLRGQPDAALPGAALPDAQLEPVQIDTLAAMLCCYAGSFLAVRLAVESRVAGERPEPLLIYAPGSACRAENSLLLELELAGMRYEPNLKRDAARPLLRQHLSDAAIDALFAAPGLDYATLATAVEQAAGGGQTSPLRLALPDDLDTAQILTHWLADPATDAAIANQNAGAELYRLVASRLGLTLAAGVDLAAARALVMRYLLLGEFRLDLTGAPPPALDIVPLPANEEQRGLLRKLLVGLRHGFPALYRAHADRVEQELRLPGLAIAPDELGSIDTFRFEERALLAWSDGLLVAGDCAAAERLYQARRSNFWVDQEPLRQAQWQICHLAAALGLACDDVAAALTGFQGAPAAWAAAYAGVQGWHRLDQAQRRLESRLITLDEEPDLAQAIAALRNRYEELTRRLAVQFGAALQKAQWQTNGVRSQTAIWHEFAQPHPNTTTAYFLVDALRYEMGAELAEQLAPLGEVALTHALAAAPAITRIGMAALLPGAATSFGVAVEGGKLAGAIDGDPIADWPARRKRLLGAVPNLVDLELAQVIQLSAGKLKTAIAGAPLIVVRSQEIDQLGESGSTLLARHIMEAVVATVARAVRKLAQAGVTRFVITADHGHLLAAERGDDMKIDNPGGQCVEIHRRCWAGLGGATPAGAVRVAGAELGYATDLDFIFPTGLGVFKAGGNLTYHHGGLSLQELVIPVVQVRASAATTAARASGRILLSDVPAFTPVRALGARFRLEGDLYTRPTAVRIVLQRGGALVGEAGMAIGADFDPATGCVTLIPNGDPVGVGLTLRDETAASFRIVVLDPATDTVLAQSDEIQFQPAIR
jgi:hypothetical protein